MPSVMKRVKRKVMNIFKRKTPTAEENNQLMEHENEGPGTQTRHNVGLTDLLAGEANQASKPDGEQIPYILDSILMGNMMAPELKEASEKLKELAQQNGICLKGYLKTVYFKILVENFPTVPEDSHLKPKEFLEDARREMCKKLTGLDLVLEDLGLMRDLHGSYHQHIYSMLDILLERSSSVNNVLSILQWVKESYLRHECKRCSNTESCTFRLSDPLLLTAWFEKTKHKVLILAPGYISTRLQNILHDEDRDYSSEESFIKLQLDVIQLLNGTIEAIMEVSQSLGNAVQALCCTEFHKFAKKYMNAEKKHLNTRSKSPDLLYLYRTMFTCEKLRSYARSNFGSTNDTNLSTLHMFENMEKQALSCAQQLFTNIAEDYLKKYFHNDDASIWNLRETIRNNLTTLPQIEQAEETKQRIVSVAFQSVIRAYLRCLTQTKYSRLESRWSDVYNRLMQDGEHFQSSITLLQNGSHNENIFLLKMSEIVCCSGVDPLKLICSSLFKDFPKESEEYLHVVLRWRGQWTRRQINEILNTSREVSQYGEHVGPHPLMYLTCGLCCT